MQNGSQKTGKEQHGLRYAPEYQVWAGIKKRCYNEKAAGYGNYGGRGIRMQPDWFESFAAFYRDMGERQDGQSIERKDVDGDYTVDNCVWADRTTQAFNTRQRKDNVSGKAGVMWDKQDEKWQAFLYKNKKRYFLGRFSDLQEAILARRAGEMLHYGYLKPTGERK
jgi:hypothetical protein